MFSTRQGFFKPDGEIEVVNATSSPITTSGTVDLSVTLPAICDGLIVIVRCASTGNGLPDSDKYVILDPGGANEVTILSTDAVLFVNSHGQFEAFDQPSFIFHFKKNQLPAGGTYTVRWQDAAYVNGSTVIGAIPVTNGGVDIRIRQKAIAYNDSSISGTVIMPLGTAFEKNTSPGSLIVAASGTNISTLATINFGTSLFREGGGVFGDAFNCSYAVDPTPFNTFQVQDGGSPARNILMGVEFESGEVEITGSVNFSASSTAMARVAEAVVTSYPFSMFAMVKPYSVPAANTGPGTDRQFGVLVIDDSTTNGNYQRLNLANSDFANSITGYPEGNIVGMARSRFQSSSLNTKITSNASYYQLYQWSALGATWATAATTPEIKAYKDGVDSTVSINNNATNFSANLNETIIGREATFIANDGRNFDGLISSVAIWNIALSAAEIESLSSGVDPLTIQTANLVCYWPGDVIGVKAYAAAVGQYMNEVIQGKYALMSGGAEGVYENPVFN